VNPVGDAAFVDRANELVADEVATPGVLQRRLREQYPRAVVRPRILSAEPIEIWYVYREGVWVRSDDAGSGLDRDLGGSPPAGRGA
jgi:hypothetical protein